MTATPAQATKQVLRQASGVLGTANPLEVGFDRLLDEALQLPRGDRAYRHGYPKAFDAGFAARRPHARGRHGAGRADRPGRLPDLAGHTGGR